MFAATGLFGCPRLVIPGGAGTVAATPDRAGRIIGVRRSSHVRLVRLLPGIARPVGARQLVDRMVQPGMPFGRHLRAFRLAIVDNPTLLAAGAASAAPHRPAAALAIIAVAVIVRADPFAPQPSQQTRAERHPRSVPRFAAEVIASLAGGRKEPGRALPVSNIWCAFNGTTTK